MPECVHRNLGRYQGRSPVTSPDPNRQFDDPRIDQRVPRDSRDPRNLSLTGAKRHKATQFDPPYPCSSDAYSITGFDVTGLWFLVISEWYVAIRNFLHAMLFHDAFKRRATSPSCCTFIETFFQCSVTMRLAAKIVPDRFALFSSFVPQNYTQPFYAVTLPSIFNVRYSTFPKSQVYTCWKLKSFYLKYSWTRHVCWNWMRRQASSCYCFGNRTVFGRNANLVFILPSKGNIRNYVIVIWSVLSFLLMWL